MDRCGCRDLLVHERRGRRYDDRVTSPATMRLMLLAAMLGTTACGDDPATSVTVPSWAQVAPEQIAEAG